MTGGVLKVWNGAGDGTVHSRPRAPSQARAGALAPYFSEWAKMKIIMNGVRNMPNAPIELTRFQSANTTLESGMRRGMPARPRKCCGKNSRLENTSVHQKWNLPHFSLYMRPVHFGHQ